MLESVDWTDLGSVVERRVGSSPTARTTSKRVIYLNRLPFLYMDLLLFRTKDGSACSFVDMDIQKMTIAQPLELLAINAEVSVMVSCALGFASGNARPKFVYLSNERSGSCMNFHDSL